MKKISEPIVFFGSGPVAAASLRLLANDFTIEAIITKPKPRHHHGSVPVLDVAAAMDVTVYTASTKQELDMLFASLQFRSRAAILIDFGIIVSQQVIDFFPLGIVNSHFSLLPEWRGADPITFSVLSGQEKTGVSLMLLTSGMDEGPLLAQGEYELTDDITTPVLTAELIRLSHALLLEILPRYLAGEITPVDQLQASISDVKEPTYSRKLSKEDGQLDFHKPAVELEREIRAFKEWPKSYTRFGTLEVTLTRAHVIDATGVAGQTAILNKVPIIYCGTQALAIDRIKPSSKKEMTGEAFLAGYKKLFLSPHQS